MVAIHKYSKPTRLQRAGFAQDPGMPSGRLRGGYVADLVALDKAVTLCTDHAQPCWKKFNAKANNYVISRTIPMVRGKCDGCGQYSNLARMYLSAKQPGVM